MDFNITYLLLSNNSEMGNNSETALKKMEERKQRFVNSAVLFCAVLFVAVLSRELLKKIHFPHTVLLFVFGVILGVLDYRWEAFRDYASFSKQPIMIELFLPVIVYDYAFEMNPYMFMMAISQCMILALPGFAFCATLNAVFAKTVFTLYKWDWSTCILFGIILCATDPSAIIDLLKDYGVSSSLTTIIEGESLLNNGIALVLSVCMMEAHGTHENFEAVALDLMVSCFGGVAIGYVVGMVTVNLLRLCENDTDMEATCTLCISYITYFVNEFVIGVSGLLALVVLGVSVGSYKSSITYADDDDTTLYQFWQTLSFWANSMIFTTVGLIITSSVFNELEYSDIGLIIATYFTISVIRGCMIVVLSPLLRTIGYGFPTEYGAVLTWGGMRGAVGLALALMTRYTPTYGLQKKLFIQVSGVIVLTLIFNASTMRSLLKVLGIGEVTVENMESMAHAVALLRDAASTTENATRMDKYYVGADWAWVRKVTHIENPYETQGSAYPTTFKLRFDAFRGYCKECQAEIRIQPNAEELKKLEAESRLLIMRALETSVTNQYEGYGILRRTFGLLNNYIENTLDTSDKYLLTENVIVKLLSINYCLKLMKKHMMDALQRVEANHRQNIAKAHLQAEASDTFAFRKWCARMYLSERMERIVFLALLKNLLTVAGEYTILFTKYRLLHSTTIEKEILVYEILNAIMALWYVMDALISICALGLQSYLSCKGNVIDFVVTSITAMQMFYGITLVTVFRRFYSKAALYVLVVWSSIRFIRLLKIIVSTVFKNLVNQCCSAFYNAFDLSIGFIVANEEVVKSAHKIVEYEECAEFARFTALNNAHEMLCYVNEFEEEHPYVVCAWRTHRAAIYILKNMKAVIEDMEDRHMLDETDAEHLIEEVASKMKDTLTSCRYITSEQNVKNCLTNVPWIKNEEVLSRVMELSNIQSFPKGEIIQEAGKKHTCLRVLYKGLVQITGRSWDEKGNILPNTDSVELFDSVGNFFQSINSPETLGLLGYLLRTPSITETVSSKYSQLITIDFEDISDIERELGDLSFHMWRQISIQIAYSVLSKEQTFENWSEEKLKIHLEEGIFPDLNDAVEFDVHPVIADVVLIQGKVKSKNANIEFCGPAFIPQAVRSLVLVDNPRNRPRVVMMLLREEKYHAPPTIGWVRPDTTHKGLCLLHGIRRATLHDAQVQNRRKTFLQTMGQFFKPKARNILGSDAP